MIIRNMLFLSCFYVPVSLSTVTDLNKVGADIDYRITLNVVEKTCNITSKEINLGNLSASEVHPPFDIEINCSHQGVVSYLVPEALSTLQNSTTAYFSDGSSTIQLFKNDNSKQPLALDGSEDVNLCRGNVDRKCSLYPKTMITITKGGDIESTIKFTARFV